MQTYSNIHTNITQEIEIKNLSIEMKFSADSTFLISFLNFI